MPIFEEGQDPLRQEGGSFERVPLGAPDAGPQFKPSFIDETLPAAFRENNTIVALKDLIERTPQGEFDPRHNPLETIKGTWAEAHPQMFVGSPNEATTLQMIARGEKENKDRETLMAAGWPGTAAAVAAGILDPTMFLVPTFAGGGVVQSALKVGAAGAAQAAMAEGVLYASHVTKTKEEALQSVASAAVLSGILGGAIGFLSPAERAAAVSAIDDMRAPVGMGAEASLSAAEADTRTMRQVSTGIPAAVDRMSPAGRVIGGESVAAKRATTELVETARRFEQEAEGAPKSLWGGSIETLNRMEKAKFETAARDSLYEAWTKHYYADDAVPTGALVRNEFSTLIGHNRPEKLSYADFKEAVYDALYSADESPIPEVAQAAKAIRRDVLDPLAERAKTTMTQDGVPLLDPDTVRPKGDASFVPRIWDHPVIAQKRNEFRGIITRWLGKEQNEKAAAKERIADRNELHSQLTDKLETVEKRIASLEGKIEETGVRLDERGQEARKAIPREDALKARATDIKEAISETEEFISAMRGELRDPDQLQRLDDLEKEVSFLRKEAKPMSAAELARIEREEIGSVLTGDLRKAAEIAIGKRKASAQESLGAWMKNNGGIYDPGGDVASRIGRNSYPGLLRNTRDVLGKNGGRGLDDWAEKLWNEFPEYFTERPSPHDVVEFLAEDHFGRPPDFWAADEVASLADNLRDTFSVLGVNPKTLREAAEVLNDAEPRVLTRLLEKAQAAGDLPGAEADLAGRYQGRRDLRDLVSRALERRAGQANAASREGARAAEAGAAANRTRGRLKILEERAARQEQMKAILDNARDMLKQMRDKARGEIEEEIKAWKGKSSAEAIAALRAREDADLARQTKAVMGDGPEPTERLKSADRPIDRAVKSILSSDRDLSEAELAARADEIIDRILSTPDGRFNYDVASDKWAPKGAQSTTALPRGALHSREFAIPTAEVRDFVVRDIEHVLSGHLRTMLPDIELTRRFGDADMEKVIKSIREEYNAKIAALGTGPKAEKEAARLHAMAQSDIEDVAAMRDRVRNIYGWTGDPSGRRAHAVARDVRNVTSMASLGTAPINSLTDFGVQAAFRYGLGHVFKDQWIPFTKSLMGLSDVGKIARQQAKEMGIGVESANGLARLNFSDVIDNYKPGNSFSRGLSYLGDRFHMVNLLGPFTDYAKFWAFVPAQAEFGRTAARIAAGKGSTKDIARMADASIPIPMAKKIAAEIEKHGVTVDGVRFANAGAWGDAEARRVFETAMNREVDILVTTPGMGDKPLWLSGPVGSVIGQFKSFTAGAHERVLIANLQKRDADTLQGMIAALGMGAISYAMYSIATGKKPSDRPQDWIKEAVDRASLMGWFSEANKVASKFTGGQADVFRLIGADRPLTRRAFNSPVAELLGPGYSLAEGVGKAIVHGATGDFTGGDLHRLRKVLPGQNLFYLRSLLDEVEAGSANAFGLAPRPAAQPTWEW